MARRKTHEEFAQELAVKHEGRITLQPGAEYAGANLKIDVHCEVCGHDWSTQAKGVAVIGTGCPECQRLNNISSAGTKRCRPSTQAEKDKAAQLRAEGWGYVAIGKELGRAHKTIQRWLIPELAEADRQLTNKRWADNPEKKKANAKAYLQTPHGATKALAHSARRRHTCEEDMVGMCDRDVQLINNMYEVAYHLNKKDGPNSWHVDHLIPLSKGGIHCSENLQVVRAEENLKKNSKLVAKDFALYQRNIADLFLFWDARYA